jgi:hypothetical protein
MNTIKSISLALNDWGVNKGKLTGSIELINQFGEIKIVVDPAKAQEIIRVLAPALVATARDTAQIMIEHVEAQAAMQAPIDAVALEATIRG